MMEQRKFTRKRRILERIFLRGRLILMFATLSIWWSRAWVVSSLGGLHNPLYFVSQEPTTSDSQVSSFMDATQAWVDKGKDVTTAYANFLHNFWENLEDPDNGPSLKEGAFTTAISKLNRKQAVKKKHTTRFQASLKKSFL
ncbi:unnamed protein product [Vicia faba]|uniref:Uncharacterized protein n=1 Tax=Vicia faba TaxID=3906 RepID=A0AAV0ZP41_VICFA|nr:unnamed protein product [Vicia faba]